MSKFSPAKVSASSSAMRMERDRFVAMAFCWADMLLELDESHTIVYAGGTTTNLMGQEPSQLIGRPLLDLVAEQDRILVKRLLEIAAKKGRIDNATICLTGKGGQPRPFGLAGYRLDDLDGHYFLALRRVPSAGKKGGTSHLKRDQDSGLYDSRSFSEVMTQLLTDEDTSTDGPRMTLIELPTFDALRKRLDEDGERRFLNTVGATLRASSINGDMATRISEDRYGVVHDIELDVKELEEQISEIARETDPSGEGIEVKTATLDTSVMGVSGKDLANGLIYTMNQFRTSEAGRFSIKGLSTNLTSLVADAADSISQFKKMVANKSFNVVFQPIIDVEWGEIHHYEALVRFDPTDETKSPYEYITFAEDTGLIPEFDLAMVERVVDWLSHVPLNSSISVAVNVSGRSIGSPKYLSGLAVLLNNNTFTRGRLLFEITESSRMTNLDEANDFIQNLRRSGHQVCLDDFGAGAANFQYMSNLQVDVVKLDGSAIQNAQKTPEGKAFLKALIGLCRELKVETIAEMIDSDKGFRFVKECGVQYVQGFLFGMPSAAIENFSKRKAAHLFSHRPEELLRKRQGQMRVLER